MDHPAKKCAGGDDDGRGPDLALGGDDAANGFALHQQIFDGGFDDRQIFRLIQRRLHRRAIELAVGLGAGTAHCRAFGAVEHAELDAGGVSDPPHQPVERVDLPHQLALAEPANRGIAGHFADCLTVLGHERGARAKTRSRSRSLAAGVPAADHNDVELLHPGIHRLACFT